MPTPFPGMDPFLESRELWPSFHSRLAVELADQLTPLVAPKYFADVDVQTTRFEVEIAESHQMRPDAAVLANDAPDVGAMAAAAVLIAPAPIRRLVPMAEVRLHSVQVYHAESGTLVTAIEILSPVNKRPSQGLAEYRRKRRRLLASSAHLLELDLLRGGQRPGPEVNRPPLDSDYVLLANRASDERVSEIWPVALNEAIPILPVPLQEGDADVPLDVQRALNAVYDRAGYARRIDYQQTLPPPDLRPAMAEWLRLWRPAFGQSLSV